MKPIAIALALAFGAAAANEASAQDHFRRHRHTSTYESRHCDACVKHFEYTKWEKKEVRKSEQVIVGYRDELVWKDVTVGYEDVVVGYEDVIVGYEDVMVTKTITEYETRTVWKRVYVGRDCAGRPIYRNQQVCERVPVCRTVRVCEKRPILDKRPICEKRPILERRQVCEKRPITECRETVTCEWVQVPVALWVCAK